YPVAGDNHRLAANHGPVAQPQRIGDTHPIRRDTPLGRAVLDRRPVHVPDITLARAGFGGLSALGLTVKGVRTVLAVPLLHDGVAVGGFVIRRTKVRPFTPKQIALLKTFADQAAIAIENARLSQALEARNADLTEALDQQTATSEILRAISSSPTDIQPVLDAISQSAAPLWEADLASVFRFDGTLIHHAAQHGRTSEEIESARRAFPQPPDRRSVTGRALLAGSAVQIADVSVDPEVEDSLRI